MIYVPSLEYSCYVVQSEGVIRAYEETPGPGVTVNYRDYYIDSNYIYRDGTQTFGQYTTTPACLADNEVTNAVWYRNDFDKILIIFLCLCIIFFKLPLKILFRLFRRFN